MMRTTTLLFVLLTASAAIAEEARRDLYGDPLPQGASMRLGTTRFRHGGTCIWAVVYSPDGKLLATGGSDNCIRLWDAQTGKEQRRLVGHTKSPTTLAFSFDSKLLASGSGDATARLWDVATGKLLHTIKEKDTLYSIAFLRDGKCLATNSTDQRIRLWDTATGKCLRALEGHKQSDLVLSVSSDGKLLASGGGRDGMICLWDATAGQLLRTCVHGEDAVHDLRFAPDGKMLACCCADGSIHLWDAATGKEIRRWKASKCDVRSLAFTPNGHSLFSGDDAGDLCEWHTSTGKRRRLLAELPEWICHLAMAPDGKSLASVCLENVIRRWDLDGGKEVLWPRGHEDEIETLRFAADDKTLISTAKDGTARLWETATGKELSCASAATPANDDPPPRVALSTNGRILATAGEEPTVCLRSRTTGKVLASFPTAARVSSLRFSPDDKTLAAWTGGSDIIYLWNVVESKLRYRIAGRMFLFSADSRLLAAPDTLSNGAGIQLWESTEGKQVRFIPPVNKHSSHQIPFCFSPDGRMLAGLHSRLDDKQRERFALVIWEVATGKERCRWSINDVLFAADFSPDGQALATAGSGQSIRLWDVRSGKETAIFHGNQGSIEALAFSKNGSRLAGGGTDTTILLWSVPASARTIADKELSPDKLRKLWTALTDSDASVAFRIMNILAASPASTTAILREQLRPVRVLDAETTRRLLADLDADDYAVRERATKELEKIGDTVESLLRQAVREKPSLELRRRAESLLDKLACETPERLRQRRALELLGWLDSAEARRLLEDLSGGAADAWLTREAKRARERHRE